MMQGIYTLFNICFIEAYLKFIAYVKNQIIFEVCTSGMELSCNLELHKSDYYKYLSS